MVGAIVGPIVAVLVSLVLVAVVAIIIVVRKKYKLGEIEHDLMEMDSKDFDSTCTVEEKMDLGGDI